MTLLHSKKKSKETFAMLRITMVSIFWKVSLSLGKSERSDIIEKLWDCVVAASSVKLLLLSFWVLGRVERESQLLSNFFRRSPIRVKIIRKLFRKHKETFHSQR